MEPTLFAPNSPKDKTVPTLVCRFWPKARRYETFGECRGNVLSGKVHQAIDHPAEAARSEAPISCLDLPMMRQRSCAGLPRLRVDSSNDMHGAYSTVRQQHSFTIATVPRDDAG